MRYYLIMIALFCAGSLATAADAPATGTAAKPYPLKTCIVTGEELGSMGKPVSKVHAGQEVQFCCKSCIKKFDKDPDGFVKKIAEAEPKAK
jgi:hypothetical protein